MSDELSTSVVISRVRLWVLHQHYLRQPNGAGEGHRRLIWTPLDYTSWGVEGLPEAYLMQVPQKKCSKKCKCKRAELARIELVTCGGKCFQNWTFAWFSITVNETHTLITMNSALLHMHNEYNEDIYHLWVPKHRLKSSEQAFFFWWVASGGHFEKWPRHPSQGRSAMAQYLNLYKTHWSNCVPVFFNQKYIIGQLNHPTIGDT